MKKLLIILTVIFISCTEPKYTYIGQEIIDGKVSKLDIYHVPYFIWVQTPTQTKKITLPFEYRNRFEVGDNCFLIIEKYKENEKHTHITNR